jgi:hypothetical protein
MVEADAVAEQAVEDSDAGAWDEVAETETVVEVEEEDGSRRLPSKNSSHVDGALRHHPQVMPKPSRSAAKHSTGARSVAVGRPRMALLATRHQLAMGQPPTLANSTST